MNTTTTAGRLRHAMTIRGLDPDVRGSKAAFAKATGLTSGYVVRLLDEKNGMRFPMAKKLAAALDVDPKWIAYGEGSMPKAGPPIVEAAMRVLPQSWAELRGKASRVPAADRASTLGRILMACERLDDRQLATLEKAANRLVAESGSLQ